MATNDPELAVPAIKHYADFYSQRNPEKVYPVEFEVRTLLGTYPNLKLDRSFPWREDP